MQAGKLDQRITIESATTAADGVGEMIKTWTTLAVVWAHIKTRSGKEIFSTGVQAEVDISFRIRYRTGLDNTMRILYEGNYYDIAAIVPFGRKEGMDIMGTARVS